MSKEIKCRYWDMDINDHKMVYFTLATAGEIPVKILKLYPIMFSTNFVDVKGVEIYNGDIICYEKVIVKGKRTHIVKHYWEVFFDDRKGSWKTKRGETESALFDKLENHYVVGNIYQNSDLMKNHVA